MKELGRDTICAEVREGLSDDEALELFYDSNLLQQSFSDWNYSQRFKAIQYTEMLIKKEGQQGKRSDLVEKKDTTTDGKTSVQNRHKSEGKSRRSTTRDRMSRNMGIATATLSKYRSIIKLPDDLIEVLAQLLDEKKITFEAAYRMSGLTPFEVETLVDYVQKFPEEKIDQTRLKDFCAKRKKIRDGSLPVRSKTALKELLILKDSKQ